MQKSPVFIFEIINNARMRIFNAHFIEKLRRTDSFQTSRLFCWENSGGKFAHVLHHRPLLAHRRPYFQLGETKIPLTRANFDKNEYNIGAGVTTPFPNRTRSYGTFLEFGAKC